MKLEVAGKKIVSQCSPVWKTGTIGEPSQSRPSPDCLNVVRSGRPEQLINPSPEEIEPLLSQCSPVWKTGTIQRGCSRVPGLGLPSQCSPVWKTGTIKKKPGSWFPTTSLNVVRSGRPEQLAGGGPARGGLWGSQCSPVWKTGTILQAVLSSTTHLMVSM